MNSALSAIGRVQNRIREIEARFGHGGSGDSHPVAFEKALTRAGGVVASAVKPPEREAAPTVGPQVGGGGLPLATSGIGALAKAMRPGASGNLLGIGGVPGPDQQAWSALSGSGGTAPFQGLIAEVAGRHNIDPALVRAVMAAESGGDPKATSPVGAIGLMQLMPGTAKDLGVADAYDPAQNVEGGAKYLAELTQKYGLEKGIAAYNAGPGAVERYGGIPPYRETRTYVDRVMRLYDSFSQQ